MLRKNISLNSAENIAENSGRLTCDDIATEAERVVAIYKTGGKYTVTKEFLLNIYKKLLSYVPTRGIESAADELLVYLKDTLETILDEKSTVGKALGQMLSGDGVREISNKIAEIEHILLERNKDNSTPQAFLRYKMKTGPVISEETSVFLIKNTAPRSTFVYQTKERTGENFVIDLFKLKRNIDQGYSKKDYYGWLQANMPEMAKELYQQMVRGERYAYIIGLRYVGNIDLEQDLNYLLVKALGKTKIKTNEESPKLIGDDRPAIRLVAVEKVVESMQRVINFDEKYIKELVDNTYLREDFNHLLQMVKNNNVLLDEFIKLSKEFSVLTTENQIMPLKESNMSDEKAYSNLIQTFVVIMHQVSIIAILMAAPLVADEFKRRLKYQQYILQAQALAIKELISTKAPDHVEGVSVFTKLKELASARVRENIRLDQFFDHLRN